MKDYLLEQDENGRWGKAIVGGDYVLIDGEEALLQRLKINTLTFIGEAIADPTKGIDYHNEVFPYDTDSIILQSAFKRAILGTSGVDSLQSFSVSQEGEKLKITATVNGTTDFETEV